MVGSWISVIPFLQGIISFVGLSAVLEHPRWKDNSSVYRCLKAVLSGSVFVRLLMPFDRGGKNVLGR